MPGTGGLGGPKVLTPNTAPSTGGMNGNYASGPKAVKVAPPAPVPPGPDNGGIMGLLGGGVSSLAKAAQSIAGQSNAAYQDPYQQYQAAIDAALQGYSPAVAGHSVGGGSSVVQSGPDLNQIMQMLGLGQQTPEQMQKTAVAQTNLSLNPKEDAIRQLLDQLNASSANTINGLNQTGAQQKSDVQSTFDRLRAYTDAAGQAGQANYASALQSTNQGNDHTIAGLAANAAAGKQAITAEQQRMGLNGLNNSRFDSDQGFLQGLAELNKNNAANTLQGQAANFGGTQHLLAESQQQAGAQAQNQIAQKLMDQLSAAHNAQQSGQNQYNSQLASLEGSRGDQNTANQAALQTAYQTQLMQAIQAAAAGQHVVSSGSSYVPGTPGGGIDPKTALQYTLDNIKAKSGDATQAAAAQRALQQLAIATQNSNTSQSNALFNQGFAPQAQALLGVPGTTKKKN